MPRKSLTALFAVSMASIVAAGLLPISVAIWYAVASTVALIAYRRDKTAATRGQRRTPEATLHGIALLGGWPGALLAQSLFRHKSSKTSFLITFWATAIANGAVLAWVVYRSA